jgi:formylglycine-generating enzyme required for sulfatase activity
MPYGRPSSLLSRKSFLLAPALLAAGARLPETAAMVLVPSGTFWMGTDERTIDTKYGHLGPRLRDSLKNESPRHKVQISSFYMDKYEVTNRRFQAFLDENPQWRRDRVDARTHNGEYLKSWHGDRFPDGKGDHPVVYVTWYAAMAFAQWARKRLPTEPEWEYAARGGLEAAEYPWGDAPASPDLANYGESNIGETTRVGRYPPNGFGLHDMAGNVWEFCLDEWRDRYDTPATLLPSNWKDVTTRRVIRGGSWGGAPVNLRVAYRDSHPPGGAGPHVGFRCVKNA